MSLDWKLDRPAPKRLEMNVRDALNIVVKYKTHQMAIQHIQKDFLTLQVKILSIKSLELTWFVKTAKVQMVRINLILNQIIWCFFFTLFSSVSELCSFFHYGKNIVFNWYEWTLNIIANKLDCLQKIYQK